MLREPERIAQEYERRLVRAPQDDDLTAKQAAVRKIQQGLDRLIDVYQVGLLERAQFEPRVRCAREQRQTLHDQIVALQAEQSGREDLQLIIGQVETFGKRLEGSLEQADWSTRRQVITTLVKQIEIHEENVKIVYRIDSLPFAPAPEGGVLQHCWWRERGRDRPWAEEDLFKGGYDFEQLAGGVHWWAVLLSFRPRETSPGAGWWVVS